MDAEKGEEKLPLKERITNFSEIYLAHHEISEKCKNHVFKIGSFYLCVGCTSVFIGIIIANIIIFSLFEFFKNNPLVLALITSFGVLIALIQLLIKPKNKWVKAFMRFSLGAGLGALLSLIVFIPNFYLKFGIAILIGIGTVLYNIVRRNSPENGCN
ncbi:MAG: hypothetical protein H7647_09425 [Candidatus Heimdallarchaeota archaeon]|nr:hypothetical protein [Candidatus Heimdallarchaeota archaeon]MCK4254648.1 hypothetical protein [Candidatus Heimdallarchaeota archaeon]